MLSHYRIFHSFFVHLPFIWFFQFISDNFSSPITCIVFVTVNHSLQASYNISPNDYISNLSEWISIKQSPELHYTYIPFSKLVRMASVCSLLAFLEESLYTQNTEIESIFFFTFPITRTLSNALSIAEMIGDKVIVRSVKSSCVWLNTC